MQSSATINSQTQNAIDKSNLDKYNLDNATHKVEIDTSTKLGEGSFGSVCLGKIDDKEAAFKTVKVNGKTSSNDIKREILIMAMLTDTAAPYTVKLMYHDFSVSKSDCVIGMNYAAHGSLEKYFPKLKDHETYNVIFGLAKAIDHMHTFNIIHCDIKAENVLLDAGLNPLLCDFGLSKRIGIDAFGLPVGTPLFRAVELFKNDGEEYNYFTNEYEYDFTESNTKEADIYSLHMTFCQILLQAAMTKLLTHLQDFDDLISHVNSGNRLDIPKPPQCTEKMAALITWGWANDPKTRPTASQVVNQLEVIQIEVEASKPNPNF